MHTEALNLSDYLVVLRWRKWPLLGVTGLLLVISISVALILPAVYRSTAMILIEQKEIPVRADTYISGSYNLYCWLPPAVAGQKSGIAHYGIVEAE
jgi:uncharacterized protein involved in exopolysaccharide biosynthesis